MGLLTNARGATLVTPCCPLIEDHEGSLGGSSAIIEAIVLGLKHTLANGGDARADASANAVCAGRECLGDGFGERAAEQAGTYALKERATSDFHVPSGAIFIFGLCQASEQRSSAKLDLDPPAPGS